MMSVRNVLFAATAALALAPYAAHAQDVIFAPDDEVIVREYVIKQPRREIVIPHGYDFVIGEEVPDTIVVSPLDAPELEREYEYVYAGDQVVLIDPQTRRIVHVMD